MYSNKTNNLISLAFDEYIDLEKKVIKNIKRHCYPICSSCSDICCNIYSCNEIFKSKWVKNIHVYSNNDFNSTKLKRTIKSHFKSKIQKDGCLFDFGRPPSCLLFFCNKIKHNMKSKFANYLLAHLGYLIPSLLEIRVGRKKITNIDLIKNDGINIDEIVLIRHHIKKAKMINSKINTYLNKSKDSRYKTIFKTFELIESHSELSIQGTIESL